MRQNHFFKNKLHQYNVGFSLIELMIAILLSAIISTTIIEIFISSKKIFQSQNDLSQFQENSRIISHLISTEIRKAKTIALYGGREIKKGTQALLIVQDDVNQKAFFISKNNNLYLKNFSGLSLSLMDHVSDMKIFFDVIEKNSIHEIPADEIKKDAEIVGVSVRLIYSGKLFEGRGIYVYSARRE